MGELEIWGLGVIHLCDESKKIRLMLISCLMG